MWWRLFLCWKIFFQKPIGGWFCQIPLILFNLAAASVRSIDPPSQIESWLEHSSKLLLTLLHKSIFPLTNRVSKRRKFSAICIRSELDKPKFKSPCVYSYITIFILLKKTKKLDNIIIMTWPIVEIFKYIAYVGSFKHFVFVYLRICEFVYLCISHLIHKNVIFDILESHAFKKYNICWVF